MWSQQIQGMLALYSSVVSEDCMQFDNYDPSLGQFSAVFSLGTVKFGVQYNGEGTVELRICLFLEHHYPRGRVGKIQIIPRETSKEFRNFGYKISLKSYACFSRVERLPKNSKIWRKEDWKNSIDQKIKDSFLVHSSLWVFFSYCTLIGRWKES